MTKLIFQVIMHGPMQNVCLLLKIGSVFILTPYLQSALLLVGQPKKQKQKEDRKGREKRKINTLSKY